MTATVPMVATAALTTHFMLRCISLFISFSIFWHFSSFSKTKTKKKKTENSLILLVVLSLQFLFCKRYNASGSDPPSPPPPPPSPAPNKRRPLHAFLIKMANIYTQIDAHAGRNSRAFFVFLSRVFGCCRPDSSIFRSFRFFSRLVQSTQRRCSIGATRKKKC